MTDKDRGNEPEPRREEPTHKEPEAEALGRELSVDDLSALCRENVCPGCEVMREAEDIRLRSLADGENLRKRLLREAEETRRYAAESVLADLLPVLDNLDLALAHAEGLEGCRDFLQGVDMTRSVFLDTLRRHGLERAGEPGQAFDPQVHEAVGVAPDADVPEGHVARVVQKGYLLRGRLLRPAKVLVRQ
ncbi:MAG: nucleotide exchange factor GrpE [Desulfovibrionaceae bacterium]|nr:nucleotide exchange factor GrpE [Desulfovibrionaceae bacterium]